MGDFCESEALLPRTLASHHKPCRGDGDSTTDEDDPCGRARGWWDRSSSRSSCSSYSSSESDYEENKSDIEWETFINPRGELFYVESNVILVPNLKVSGDTSPKTPMYKRKIPGGRLSDLITYKRRANKKLKGWFLEGWPSVSNSKSDILIPHHVSAGRSRPSKDVWPNRSVVLSNGGGNKVTFRDSQEGEAREVGLAVDPGQRNLGRRATLCETLLGIVPGVFSSSAPVPGDVAGDVQAVSDDRIMVAGFVPDGEAIKNRSIKIGDWLRKIDENEVTFKTIDEVLSSIISPCTVKLILQRVAGCDVTADLPQGIKCKPLEQSKLVRTLLGSSGEDISVALTSHPIGLLYVAFPKREQVQEGSTVSEDAEVNDVIYFYPPAFDLQSDALAGLRGSFLTLRQLVPEIAPSAPVSSTILLKGKKTHVVYFSEGSEMLLVATPDGCCSIPEAILLTEDLIRALRFNFQTLSKAFKDSSHKPGLNHLLDIHFTKILIGGFWSIGKVSNICNEIASKANLPSPHLFEEILPASHLVSLPRDVQNQIDDALTQLESADFQCLNEEYHQCQRLLTVVGSCIYHKGYLLTSHLPTEDLPCVHSFLSQLGILHLCRKEPVRSLVFWREVYLPSCNRGLKPSTATEQGKYPLPKGRWFLLIVGKGQQILVVALEMGGCSVRQEGAIPPDPDYVSHAKNTLNHIQKIGIPAVCDSWLASGGLPQVDSLESLVRNLSMRKGFRGRNKSRADRSFLSFRRSSEPTPSSKAFNAGNTGISSQSANRKPEVTSILKRRDSPALVTPQGFGNCGSIGGDTTASEDSVSIGGASGGGTTRDGSILYGIASDDSSSAAGMAVGSVVGRRAQRESLGSIRQSSSASSLGVGLSVFPSSSSPLGVSVSSRSSVSDCDDEDESSVGSDLELYQSESRSSHPFDLTDLKNNLLNEVTDLSPIKLTTGDKNVLLFYLSMSGAEGVFVCPPDFPTNECSPSMQYLVENFRHSSMHIHNLLQHSIAFKDVKGPNALIPWINKSLVAVKEHGVLFDFSEPGMPSMVDGFKKVSTSLSYWVVGRLFFSPQPKEVYVCYFDSAPQNMVEIAFRLGLSVTG